MYIISNSITLDIRVHQKRKGNVKLLVNEIVCINGKVSIENDKIH